MERIDANGDGLLTDNEEYLSIVTVKKSILKVLL